MRPVVFLHGSFGCAADWDAIRRAFPSSMALDVPGHGQALDAARGLTWTAAVDDVLDRTPKNAVLVGYSMGGRLALSAALRAPGHVAALVLESSNPGLESPAARAARRELDDDRARALQADPSAFLARFWDQPLFDSLRRHPGYRSLLEERVGRAGRDPALLAEAFCALSPASQPNHWPALASLTLPTLILSGGLDAKYRAIGERMAKRLSDANHVVVQSVGHNVHLEAPERFTMLLELLLVRLGPLDVEVAA